MTLIELLDNTKEVELKKELEALQDKPEEERVKIIQEKYMDYFLQTELVLMNQIKEFTGIKPDLPEYIVQEKYKELKQAGFDKYGMNIVEMLEEITGIKAI
ncbi:MAG: hypothetical protein KJ623_01730 [Nanoarchaeota archaeon]|nr:hypothetical protein [Nanoarchaeota archaeon]MBU0963080.1 hypothetical protein [Nanoarchaeota archaeon]